jgi:hypothetical protein
MRRTVQDVMTRDVVAVRSTALALEKLARAVDGVVAVEARVGWRSTTRPPRARRPSRSP